MLDEEEYYERRDDRTDIVTDWDASKEPLVIVSPRAKESRPIQAALLVLANTVARFLPHLTIAVGDEHPYLLDDNDNRPISRVLEEVMQEADPFGSFVVTDSPPESWNRGPVVALGDTDRTLPSTIFRPLRGSVQIVPEGADPDNNEEADRIGGLLAGCLAAREIFLEVSSRSDRRAEDTYIFRPFEGAPYPNEGQVKPRYEQLHLIGVGGVGANIVYMIPLLGWTPRIHLIDDDVVTWSNLNRCLPFTAHHAHHAERKVDAGASYLEKHGIQAERRPMRYGEYVEESGRGEPDAVLMMANEDYVWNTVQNNFPPTVYSAATSPNWSVHTSRHIPLHDACVACLWGQHDHETPPMACDVGDVSDEEEEEELGVLPFLSPLAAVLTLGEMALTENLTGSPGPNLRITDLKSQYPRTLATTLTERSPCVCQDQNDLLYRDLLRATSE